MAFDSRLYIVDPTTGDLIPNNRRTLGQYLSSATSKSADLGSATGGPDDYTYSPPAQNAYPISPNTSDETVKGSVISDPARNGQASFTTDPSAMQNFAGGRTLRNVEGAQGSDLHHALPDISNNLSTNPVAIEGRRRIGSVLSQNRFTSSRTTTPDNGDLAVVAVDNRRLVSDNPLRSSVLTVGNESNSLYEQMRLEGIAGVLRSAGITVDDVSLVDKVSATAAFAAGARNDIENLSIETKLNVDEFRARRAVVTDRLAFDKTDAEVLGSVADPTSNKSYGQMNTPVSPFATAAPTAMIVNSALFAVAAMIAVEAISGLLDLLIKETGRFTTGNNQSDLEKVIGNLGSSRTRPRDTATFVADALGVCLPYGDDNKYEGGIQDAYRRRAEAGVLATIGAGDSDSLSGAFLGAGFTVATSPGFYGVLARNLTRNIEDFGDFSGITGDGITGGIEGVASYLSMIKRSKLLRFVDTMARIGIALEYKDRPFQSGLIKSTEVVPSGSKVPPHERVSKSRAFADRRELAWSFTQAHQLSKYLLPDTFVTGSSKWTDGKSTVTSLGPVQIAGSRISRAESMKIEEDLNAEYVPFYFKDMRTNEILNFHAFIDELTDSYSPSYTQVDAYGRMDPVQIYKGTTRSISLSFMIVATNPADFDAMWNSINRLTMMVYPEWTRGNELNSSSGDGKLSFIQPFSQVPGSSPMVRLRVGDLVKSNYSRFGLARIFGLGEKDRLGNDMLTNTNSPVVNMSETRNSIVRSFESAEGKGLAGFITSLGYTWYDENTLWEVTAGSAAPMMCKVSIQFAPIHDIPLGLDHNGFMRAPAYPVGGIVNNVMTGSM